ncbi:MAG: hypothetical protein ACKO9Q_03940 [Pirellula sp.]
MVVRNHSYMVNGFDLEQGNRSLGLLIDELDSKWILSKCRRLPRDCQSNREQDGQLAKPSYPMHYAA